MCLVSANRHLTCQTVTGTGMNGGTKRMYLHTTCVGARVVDEARDPHQDIPSTLLPSSRTATRRTECLPASPSTFQSVSTAHRLNVPPLRHSPSVGSWMKKGLLLLLLLPSRPFSRWLVALASFSLPLVEVKLSARTESLATLCKRHQVMALRRPLARFGPRVGEAITLERAKRVCVCMTACLASGMPLFDLNTTAELLPLLVLGCVTPFLRCNHLAARVRLAAPRTPHNYAVRGTSHTSPLAWI